MTSIQGLEVGQCQLILHWAPKLELTGIDQVTKPKSLRQYASLTGGPMWTYLKSSTWLSILGLGLSGYVGYYFQGTMGGVGAAVLTCFLLALLEVSISFDNAIVNAVILKDMTPLWRHRFLTWGILIAVFGMRLVFPLLIVSVATGIGPWDALRLATSDPEQYKAVMLSVHHEIAAFGGAFLMMVALNYFFDKEKEDHWLHIIEKPMLTMGRIKAIELGLVLIMLLSFGSMLAAEEKLEFIVAGIAGLLTYLAVEGLSEFLKVPEGGQVDINKASAGMFIYLEVLDASFSFDGVIGAFALTSNIFLIAIGLGIGALYVRSLTIMFVEKETLSKFRYLEHGAFYAMASLAMTMFIGSVVHVPEIITGVIGAAIIGMSLLSSLKAKAEARG